MIRLKILLLSALFITGLIEARPEKAIELFGTNNVSHMTLGLLMCEKASPNIDCNFNYDREVLNIYGKFPESIKESVFNASQILEEPTNEDICKHIMTSSPLNEFVLQWMSKDYKGYSPYTYNKFTEAFFEKGFRTLRDGRDLDKEKGDWLTKNIRLSAFVGNDSILADATGLMCTYYLARDSYISTSRVKYSSFLGELNN
jgi:hypothetical protein